MIAIRGHKTRGSEVIALLEMLGGKNKRFFNCARQTCIYFIGDDNDISMLYLSLADEKFVVFTLEEFLEKFPYKVGDKVRIPEYESEVRIISMNWNGYEVQYEVFTDESEWYSAEELNEYNEPYKEEIMENKPDLLQQLKGYFDNTPREIIEKEWHKYDKYNKIEPTVKEYLEYVNSIRQPKYPKTYKECHELMVQWKGYNCNLNSELILCEAPIHDFCKLIVARNIYWKIAGEQMELGKPWEPDWTNNYQKKWTINFYQGEINLTSGPNVHFVLAFPTEEMRDAFYENFKDLVETCKEFL